VEDLAMREHMRGQRTALAALLALVLLGCDEKTERAAEADLKEADAHVNAARWCEARIALARAEGRLASGGPKAYRQRVEQMQKDIEMVQRLDAIRLGRADTRGGADRQYAAAFRSYGLDVTKLKPEEASRQVRASVVREELLLALHEWAMVKPVGEAWKALLAATGEADDNPWRKRLRQAMEEKDRKALTALAGDEQTLKQPPAMLVLLARALRQANLSEEALNVLRQGQRRHPADFWLNHDLGDLLARQRGSRDEAVRYFQAALALRPDTPRTYLTLGSALLRQGRPDEAVICFRRAIALDPQQALAHTNLGVALAAQGKMDEAIACQRRAIQLDPKSAQAYLHLGTALQQVGKFAEAIGCFRSAIELDPAFSAAHSNLGGALAATGRNQEAIACFRKAIALDPKSASAHLRLGTTLLRAGKLDEAIACYRQAIRLKPDYAEAHFNLGHALRGKGQLDDAIACYRKALALKPDLKAAKKALEEAMKIKAER
jgi:tetratricopeptide (TPR) repeat protein